MTLQSANQPKTQRLTPSLLRMKESLRNTVFYLEPGQHGRQPAPSLITQKRKNTHDANLHQHKANFDYWLPLPSTDLPKSRLPILHTSPGFFDIWWINFVVFLSVFPSPSSPYNHSTACVFRPVELFCSLLYWFTMLTADKWGVKSWPTLVSEVQARAAGK